jgi:hypothetical protein
MDTLDHQKSALRTAYPQVREPITIECDEAPWRLYLDFSTFDGADKAELQQFIEVVSDHGPVWQLAETYEVGIVVEKGVTYLTVNGVRLGRQKIGFINAVEGPWRAKLTYEQQFGINKKIRWMRVF